MERVVSIFIAVAGFLLVAVDSPNFRPRTYTTERNPLFAVEVKDEALEAIREQAKRNLLFRF